ncbi:hypothetical protein [Escherichia coli]|uniref:hypothetical protein n=1 Tax=Escherichia coli TaxID=562 RepID=UPI002929D521|nr:hypothetical protein [Escherichia coli]MDU9640276.1 hypothetical protein [Escherichia coli]
MNALKATTNHPDNGERMRNLLRGREALPAQPEKPFSARAGGPRRGGAKWHLNRSQFGIRIDHDLASISDHSLASQSITIWHASDH